jgi:hypothetical protein
MASITAAAAVMPRKRRALIRDAVFAVAIAVVAATTWKLLAVFLFPITTP